MIKFAYIIHKPTKIISTYNEWLEWYRENKNVEFKEVHYIPTSHTDMYEYNPRDMIFSDDFKIIYESELTQEDLREILRCFNIRSDVIYKIKAVYYEREKLIRKYSFGSDLKL